MSTLPPTPLLEMRGLRIRFGTTEVVAGFDLSIAPGECVALVGESGSGKSVSARSILGLAGTGSRVDAEVLRVGDTDVLGLSERALRRLRGGRVGLIPQDALGALDPLRPIGHEIDRTLQLHTRLGASARHARALELLRAVGMPEPEARIRQRPGQLSGGLRQRALIASVLAGEPELLIADEPTTALDARVRRGILDLLGSLRDAGTGLLLVSHDLDAVRGIADTVAVMSEGRIIERGPAARILEQPAEEYTRILLAASPASVPRGVPLLSAPAPRSAQAPNDLTRQAVTATATPILEAHGLSKTFDTRGFRVSAVQDATLTLLPGATLGLIGESGSGKSTLARLILGLETPDAGSVTLAGKPWVPAPESSRRARRHRIGAIFQDPLATFDPRLSVDQILADAHSNGQTLRAAGWQRAITDSLDAVGLPRTLARRGPRELSGGQRQRLSIARALAQNPDILVCDEPVSALDLTVQARVLDLLDALQRERGLSLLFISHDLDVVRHVSDTVAVMKDGEIRESGPAERVFGDPRDEYTRALLADTAAHR
ncbi:peptide/nickel transport system ATP-binding protein [Mycetocola sp. BIGb0189]|uniref:ATP-binding cassette domain-containing protein n=1 Tax=Mycetocola sp. BIGb0189 TaxID=2940604 RepID=UPI0021688F66|nr:ABC transporter ATP-binding protein [Mycetocola sp. BIGb0189]MCS4275895.1 peptide/nickel transport system ATP-binding protein [Mycetocola sp. BIGb0189]